jgi:hypothetical protein
MLSGKRTLEERNTEKNTRQSTSHRQRVIKHGGKGHLGCTLPSILSDIGGA